MARRKFKHHLIYFAARALMAVIGRLPYAWTGAWGRVFGALVFNLSAHEREKTLRNIRTAMPKIADEEARKLALAVWTGVGRNLFEVIRWTRMTHEGIVAKAVRTRGAEHL